MSLSSYITHHTGAGPGGPLAHMDDPQGHLYQMAVETASYSIASVIITIQNKEWLS